MSTPLKIAVLGSTGSIGRQTLDIVAAHPDLFEIVVLIAGSNYKLLAEQTRKFLPKISIIADESKYREFKNLLCESGVVTQAGEKAILESMTHPDVDMVVTSTVGYSGLLPTLKAIGAGKDIALANKETLVVAGELVMKKAKESGVSIFPVDSEHSAISQCLMGEEHRAVRQLIITASGGPFRTTPYESLSNVTAQDALKHPNWSMGRKITIDSATMMNKAFEIIEASWLFDIPADKIKPLVHPQSIVHSMVEFVDGCIKAQLGVPDMRLPIKLALTKGTRLPAEHQEEILTLDALKCLTFEEPDYHKFPCLKLASFSLKRRGNTACVINAANEIAVDAFLKGAIKYTDIYGIIEETIERVPYVTTPTLEDYVQSNSEACKIASEIIAQ